jgi:hypothetical protein
MAALPVASLTANVASITLSAMYRTKFACQPAEDEIIIGKVIGESSLSPVYDRSMTLSEHDAFKVSLRHGQSSLIWQAVADGSWALFHSSR